MTRNFRKKAPALLVGGALLAGLAGEVTAEQEMAGATRTSVNRSANVDADRNWHPATVAAVTSTAAVIGSVTRTLPPACVPVQMGAVVYQQCGGTYYQPQYVGTAVQYVVVSPP